MPTTFPGMTVEALALQPGCSKQLYDGVFATGGITLSQVSVMTGLEPYLIQNWVKRGFLSPPVKRLYSRQQLARIVIINMLREALQIEKICGLIRIIDGAPHDTGDDLIGDEELYHRYVDMLALAQIDLSDEKSVARAADAAAADFAEREPGARKKLSRILQVMLYAHAASQLRDSAEAMLQVLQ